MREDLDDLMLEAKRKRETDEAIFKSVKNELLSWKDSLPRKPDSVEVYKDLGMITALQYSAFKSQSKKLQRSLYKLVEKHDKLVCCSVGKMNKVKYPALATAYWSIGFPLDIVICTALAPFVWMDMIDYGGTVPTPFMFRIYDRLRASPREAYKEAQIDARSYSKYTKLGSRAKTLSDVAWGIRSKLNENVERDRFFKTVKKYGGEDKLGAKIKQAMACVDNTLSLTTDIMKVYGVKRDETVKGYIK